MLTKETLKLACRVLKDEIPEITPERLQNALALEAKEAQNQIELITVNEAAELLGCCTMTIYRMVSRGEIKRYPVGRGKKYRLNKYDLLTMGVEPSKS